MRRHFGTVSKSETGWSDFAVSERNMRPPSQAKFHIAILTEASRELDAGLLDLPRVDWLLCRPLGEHRYGFYRGDRLVGSVDLNDACLDVQLLLGIIVVGDEALFQDLKSQWKAALPSAGTLLAGVPREDTAEILRAGMECLAEHLTDQLEQFGRGALDLANYRQEFDRLERNFSRLEEFVSRYSLQNAIETFEYAPGSGPITEATGQLRFDQVVNSGGLSLLQGLPVDSLGLSGVSLYIGEVPQGCSQALNVRLRAIETGEIFAEWSLDGARLRPGWIELALSSAIDEPALSLTLEIEWPEEKSGWALALGPPHPYKDFCAQVADGNYLHAPLALRIFSSLPGVRVAASTNAIRAKNARHVLSRFVPIASYASAAQVLPALSDNAPTLVFYDKEIRSITVHPCAGGPAAARIHVTAPKHCWGISAQVHLAHERASLTEFAMMVCAPRQENKELGRLGQLHAPSPQFSGWKSLSPLTSGSISIVLAAGTEGPLSLHLLTRQAHDASPDFAWARFSKLEFNLLPRGLTLLPQGEAPAPIAEELEPVGKELP